MSVDIQATSGVSAESSITSHWPFSRRADPSGPLAEFTLFPKFPREVRNIIWKHSMPGERFIEFNELHWPSTRPMGINVGSAGEEEEKCCDGWYLIARQRVPDIFFVCKEANDEVSLYYTPVPSCSCGFPTIWVNFKIDIFCFRALSNEPQLQKALKHIQKSPNMRVQRVLVDPCEFKEHDQLPIGTTLLVRLSLFLGEELKEILLLEFGMFSKLLHSCDYETYGNFEHCKKDAISILNEKTGIELDREMPVMHFVHLRRYNRLSLSNYTLRGFFYEQPIGDS